MTEILTYPTVSTEDVINIVNQINSKDSCFGNITEDEKTAMYNFASELTGISIDSMFEMSESDDTVDDIPVISQDDILETIEEMQHSDDYDYSEKQMDAIYMFISELMGISIDGIFELMGQE